MTTLPDLSEAASTALTAVAQKIQALAQTGLTYAAAAYDIERYEQLRDIAGDLMTQPPPPTDARTFISEFKQQEGYATLKVDARALILCEGKILLVKEADDSAWSLPGGWADVGDCPSTAVCREAREETRLQVEATRLLGLWDRNLHGHPPYPWHVYKLIFHCRETNGALRLSPESLDIDFFDPDRLPPLSLTRIVPEEIHTSLDIIKNAADAWFD
ncbi:MAG: NUDIX hydrolase [Sodalis sp. (in: enterobacteria)]|uniref:NUDIX hydrolase n=1 Tax=Sodalis sp. (in: enterobacteria) TaxID=1898979 RepID=UPI003F2A7F33